MGPVVDAHVRDRRPVLRIQGVRAGHGHALEAAERLGPQLAPRVQVARAPRVPPQERARARTRVRVRPPTRRRLRRRAGAPRAPWPSRARSRRCHGRPRCTRSPSASRSRTGSLQRTHWLSERAGSRRRQRK